MAKKKKKTDEPVLKADNITLQAGDNVLYGGYDDTTEDSIYTFRLEVQRVTNTANTEIYAIFYIYSQDYILSKTDKINIDIPFTSIESQSAGERPIDGIKTFTIIPYQTQIYNGIANVQNQGKYYYNQGMFSFCQFFGNTRSASPEDYVSDVYIRGYNDDVEYSANMVNDTPCDVMINNIIYHNHEKATIYYKPAQNFTINSGDTTTIYFYNSLADGLLECYMQADGLDGTKHDVKICEDTCTGTGPYAGYYVFNFNANDIQDKLQYDDCYQIWNGETYKVFIQKPLSGGVYEQYGLLNMTYDSTLPTSSTTTKTPSIYDIRKGGGNVKVCCYVKSSSGSFIYGKGAVLVKDSRNNNIPYTLSQRWDEGLSVREGGMVMFITTSEQDGSVITVTYKGQNNTSVTKKYTQEPSSSSGGQDDTITNVYSSNIIINMYVMFLSYQVLARPSIVKVSLYNGSNKIDEGTPLSEEITIDTPINESFYYITGEDDAVSFINCNFNISSSSTSVNKQLKMVIEGNINGYQGEFFNNITLNINTDNIDDNFNTFYTGSNINSSTSGFLLVFDYQDTHTRSPKAIGLYYVYNDVNNVIEYLRQNNALPNDANVVNTFNSNITLSHFNSLDILSNESKNTKVNF